MINLVVAPIVLPLLTGAVLLFAPRRLAWQRTASLVSMVLGLAGNLWLAHRVWTQGIQVFFAGNWQAPFGIALVADLTSVAFVTVTSIAALAVLIFSRFGLSRRREEHHY